MAKSNSLAVPTETVCDDPRSNAMLGSREHLTPDEVKSWSRRPGPTPWPPGRDHDLVAFRHGLALKPATAGTRSISTPQSRMCGGSERHANTHCSATRCALRRLQREAMRHRSSSSASGEPRSPRLASHGGGAGRSGPPRAQGPPHMLREACGCARPEATTPGTFRWLGIGFAGLGASTACLPGSSAAGEFVTRRPSSRVSTRLSLPSLKARVPLLKTTNYSK
jgi:hypothetical protein